MKKDGVRIAKKYIGDLNIAGTTIKCAVLNDSTRVLTQGTVLKAIGRRGKAKTWGDGGGDFKTPVFLTANNLSPFISNELKGASKPIFFEMNNQPAIGYRAEILPQICKVYIDAEEAGVLSEKQKHIAQKCKQLIFALSVSGIIGLVDEATGYQYARSRRALHNIFDKFISAELRQWAKTFPDEFYEEMFRLKGWQYSPWSVKRPSVVGHYTNNLVYDRLAPGVLEELKRITPKDESGRHKHRLHQRLTEDIGHQKLREHIASLITLMKAAANWDHFKRMVQRSLPRYQEQMAIDYEIDLE